MTADASDLQRAREVAELSGKAGELRDRVAEAIRDDGSDLCDQPWETLSDERKEGWRGDADRALAVVKDYLTSALAERDAAIRRETLEQAAETVQQWAELKLCEGSAALIAGETDLSNAQANAGWTLDRLATAIRSLAERGT